MTVVAISNTVASDNSTDGLEVDDGNGSGPFLAVSIDIARGNGTGIVASGRPTVLLGRSVVTLNNVGVQNQTTFGASFFTYKDNRINANPSGTDIGGPTLNSSLTLQ